MDIKYIKTMGLYWVGIISHNNVFRWSLVTVSLQPLFRLSQIYS